jgi:hypothetical protein
VITEEQPAKPIRLEVDDRGFGTLMIGDEDISNAINEVTVVARVGKPNLVTCHQNEPGVRVEMGMPLLALLAEGYEVKLRDEEHAALVALGWTPPAVA